MIKTGSRAEINGIIDNVEKTEQGVIITITTIDENGGKKYPNKHNVKVKDSQKLFHIASLSMQGDIVSIMGPINIDKSIVPIRFTNHTLVFDAARSIKLRALHGGTCPLAEGQ